MARRDLYSGHGTHVTVHPRFWRGISPTERVIRGLRPSDPGSSLFQAIEQKLEWTPAYRQAFQRRYGRPPAPFGLAGLPAEFYAFFSKAYEAGVRIHNNSWGGGAYGAYDNFSESLYRSRWDHKDFVVLVAAGNDGADQDRYGKIDPGQCHPASHRQELHHRGASESERSGLGYQASWGQLWPGFYPRDPIRGDERAIRPMTSPCSAAVALTRDGRIKPDVVAPGTNIVSTRSHRLEQGAHGWGDLPPLPQDYMADGRTTWRRRSPPAPWLSASNSLRQQGRRSPSVAPLKALLLHGAGSPLSLRRGPTRRAL